LSVLIIFFDASGLFCINRITLHVATSNKDWKWKLRLSWHEIISITLHSVCRQAINEMRVGHCDLKTANIMLRSDDSLAIADFGIYKQLDNS